MDLQDSNILTIDQVAHILNICRVKAYELIHQKDFPVIKIGRTYRVSKAALYRWIDNQINK